MKLTKRNVEFLPESGKRQFFSDDDLPGFALRTGTSGKKTFCFFYRAGKGRGAVKKMVTLGSFPAMTVEQAREQARSMAAIVQQGGDPARNVREEKQALTMAGALQIFQDEHVSKLKPKTIKLYTGLITNHLVPAFGKHKVKDISSRDMARLHQSLKGTPYLANRLLVVASSFFNWCEVQRYRGKADNPCQGITKYKEESRHIFMGEVEVSRLGEAITTLEGVGRISAQAAAAIRLLMFTGARVGEVLSLQWQYIDLERGIASLPDSKTGFKVLQLPAPAVVVIDGLPQFNEWVFPANSESGHMINIAKAWSLILKQSGLVGWRLHDLRHAFASMMVNSGASLPIVGKILGHANISTTQRYAHLEQNPARKAAEEAAAKIADALNTPLKRGKVMSFKKVINDTQ